MDSTSDVTDFCGLVVDLRNRRWACCLLLGFSFINKIFEMRLSISLFSWRPFFGVVSNIAVVLT